MTECEAALVVAGARGLGAGAAKRLLQDHGSFAAAVEALTRPGAASGRLDRVCAALRASAESGVARRQLSSARSFGATYVPNGDAAYPRPLSAIARPPVGLFVKGSALTELPTAVAVVGSRAPTPRGRAVARRLASDLVVAGLAVVSGMARGIDTEAHRGALEAGGPTVAVLGSGLDRPYPPENEDLAARISSSGAVVSEFPMGADARRESFPRRNRIISGLSAGVIVVEAGRRSGALITTARALEQGREVFAVPGPIDEPLSRGPNGLIRAGAVLIEGVEDVLAELERAWGPFGQRADTSGSGSGDGDVLRPAPVGVLECGVARSVLSGLSLDPVSAGVLAERTGLAVEVVLSALLELELAGSARAWPGGLYTLDDERR